MNLKLITDKNYLLFFDTGKLCSDGEITFNFGKLTSYKEDEGLRFYEYGCFPLVAHLPLNNSPVLEGITLLQTKYSFKEAQPFKGQYVCLYWEDGSKCEGIWNGLDYSIQPLPTYWSVVFTELPKQEEDLEKLALKAYPKVNESSSSTIMMTGTDFAQREAFKKGYKAASKKWTDEDLKAAFDEGTKAIIRKIVNIDDRFHRGETEKVNVNEEFNKFLQSLSPTSFPIGFEPAEETVWEASPIGFNEGDWKSELKIEKGILQGTYKF